MKMKIIIFIGRILMGIGLINLATNQVLFMMRLASSSPIPRKPTAMMGGSITRTSVAISVCRDNPRENVCIIDRSLGQALALEKPENDKTI
jgi:hypothetical protein